MRGIIVFSPTFIEGKDRPVGLISDVFYEEEKFVRQFCSTAEGVKEGPDDKGYKTLDVARAASNHEYNTAVFVEVDDVDELMGMLGNYLPESTG